MTMMTTPDDDHPASRQLRSVARPVISKEVAIARAALVMQRQGKTLWEIADALGLSQSHTASAIRTALGEAQTLVDEASKRELLSLELSRLDALQSALWQEAMAGDTKSTDSILKIITMRAKMLGLVDTTDTATSRTVVVTGDSTSYIEALRAITAGGMP
jgi:hypothetical protein